MGVEFCGRAVADLPMTEAARTALQQFNPTLNCVPKGMPTIMDQPFPIAFEDREAQILLRIEEYDIVRTIHMDREAAPEF